MNFKPFPKLQSQRLILRQTTTNDCKEILFLRSDKEVNKYIQRAVANNNADAKAFILTITKGIENGELIYWSISLKENPQMIGSICLWKFSDDGKEAEVGYDLNPKFQGQGIMSEALKMVLDFGFNQLGLAEILAFTHAQNQASVKLLSKNNFGIIEGRKDADNENNIVFKIMKNVQ